MQAYSLLRSAAGLLQFVKEKCAPLLANVCPSLDCNSQVKYEHLSTIQNQQRALGSHGPLIYNTWYCTVTSNVQAQNLVLPSTSIHSRSTLLAWRVLLLLALLLKITSIDAGVARIHAGDLG